MGLTDLFSRRRKSESDANGVTADGPVYPTKALPRFLSMLGARQQPVLLDLGPVVGSNVNFFGEQLGCKIFVEDLFKDIDRYVREDRLDDLKQFLAQRFPRESGSVDGVLCWDVFDYLDRVTAQPLAQQLTRMLRPDGVLLAFFSTVENKAAASATYTRHIVVDQATLQHKPYPAARGKQRPLVNRDIQRIFEPLRITDQFLLKTNMREVLFRKPAETAAPAAE